MTINYNGVLPGSFPDRLVGPSPGDYVTATSIGVGLQDAANQDLYLYDTKVDRAGDTMTGTLDVTGTSGTNNAGVSSTGDGTGAGLVGEGGASSGTGVVGVGGASNGWGGDFTGTGSGTGVKCTSGSGRALDVGTGNAVFTGASPAANANPGANNYQCGANVVHARATVQTNGAGGTLLGGFGISSISASSTDMTITFHRAFADANEYTAVVSNNSANAFWAVVSGRTTSSVSIRWYDTGGIKNPTLATYDACLIVSGRQ